MTPSENDRRILRRDPDPHLFRPLEIRSARVKNRIMLSPMCQYSAADSLINDWHFAHLAARAAGGAGIVFTEAVHTEPRGRITPFDLGLWNDQQRDRMRRVTEFIASQDAVPGIQLGHAGRKASTTRPWEGTRPLPPAEGGWEVIAPSPVPASPWQAPQASDSYAALPFAMLSGVEGMGGDALRSVGVSLAKRGENCFT